MFPRPGSAFKAGRPAWQRLLRTRSTRLCIFSVGCVALVTYVWVVFFLHPAHVARDMRSQRRAHDQLSSGTSQAQYTATSRQSASQPELSERTTYSAASPSPPPSRPPPSPPPPKFHPLRHYPHKDSKYRIWKLPAVDRSPRCAHSGICDNDHTCGDDKMGCITDALERKDKVREAARWTWKGYRQFAWGHDELNAGTQSSREWFNMGLTIVDSLDTLQILGLLEEYAEARFWVANHLNLNQGEVSVFETTIRILGGLAAAFYHSGGDELYLNKAIEFAERLMPSFNTSSGIPQPHFNVHDTNAPHGRLAVGSTCLAEAATLSMEFSAVSRLSGRLEFREKAMVPWHKLLEMHDMDGLYCTFMNGDIMGCNGNHFTFGASADSAYEYMLKQWILNGDDKMCLDMYQKAIGGMRKHMLTELWMGEDIGDVWIAAENDGGLSKALVLEHLTCFLPGTLALGHMYGVNTANSTSEDDDLTVAVKLMKACYELYHQTASGVAFDSVTLVPHYSPPPPPPPSPPSPPPSPPPPSPPPSSTPQATTTTAGQVQGGSAASNATGGAAGGAAGAAGTGQPHEQQMGLGGGATKRRLLGVAERPKLKYEFVPRSRENFLRPEVAESLFYLWRATGDPIYREWGWNMFRAYERWCRVSTGGYQVLSEVDMVPPLTGNKMESFWMAETMKYFYLLFSDDPDEIPLDEFVFNTEAHPLARWGSDTDARLLDVLAKFHEGRPGAKPSGSDTSGKVADWVRSTGRVGRGRKRRS